jgi:glycosyltransferase involved in cell wall biosynthesis
MQLLMNVSSLGVESGVELQAFQMTRELARRGYRIDLLFNQDGELGPEWRSFCHSASQVPTFRFSRKRAVRDVIRLAPAVRAAVHARPDVVYVNSEDCLPFALCSGLIARASVVCHLHKTFPRPSFPRLAARVHRLVAVSEFLRDEYIEVGVAPSKMVVVHNGIDVEDYPPATEVQRAAARQKLGLPEDAFVTLHLGRLEPEKGTEVLLKAWRHLALPLDHARLLIVGSPTVSPDPDARLQELEALAPPGCHWLPMQRDVVTPLHAADVLAVPSTWHEPFGRVVVEGLAAGLPVVASRVGGIPEILDGDLAPLLFEPGSHVELADLLASLVDWRKDRPDLGQRCSAHAAERFGIGQMVDGIERVLEDAVA